ncbi:MAG: N-6 DNA methylase [Zoogloeaceae bacterium]|jgi:type I restriction-modification system DNA methylase subunit/restriction endonuclease S subunit|nr:N-6 DNA methylase [Zoogloeaceae bacterium]
MINEHSFKALLPSLGFDADASGNIFSKRVNDSAGSLFAGEMKADFVRKELVYPEDSGLKVNGRQTCNFSAPENFVVFECVHRLLAQGYQPAHIELEHSVTVGHGASGGRLDIWVKDNDGKSLLIIECKTAGKEFEDAWKATQEDGDQLFSYANALDSKTPFVALYASDWDGSEIVPDYRLISLQDNEEFLKSLPKDAPSFQKAATAKERFRAWTETYRQDFTTRGLFEPDIAAYTIGKTKYSTRDLKEVDGPEIQKKYHEFATILRQHNVSGHENAFDKLVNLFLAKIVDENTNRDELKFYWKGAAYDDVFSLTDRLQYLYKIGMKEFLGEEVTYIDNNDIENAFHLFKKDATKRTILAYFRELKFFTNNDFAFIDVHNEKLFHQNAAVLLKIVRMLQDIRLQTEESHQFLGDLFEGFLDKGVKQSEGQFFTPTPIVRFLVSALPLEKLVSEMPKPPRVIDYACGAGHFLNEYCHRIFPFVRKKHRPDEGAESVPDRETFQKYYAAVTGIEKEYRLSKVSKVSASMYGQDDIHIIYADALAAHPDVADNSFDVLIANPPYSVKGFLETLSEADRARYDIFSGSDDITKNNSIECFFVERAKQLLAPGGVAAIILPSSVLSNTGIYTRMREILLKYFDIVAIAEFGSGTFGKTGTNTATLFLRRKAGKPDLAEHYQNRVEAWFEGDFSKDDEFDDSRLLAAYCAKIGIPLDDYKTLLAGHPNAALIEAGIFKEYRKAFDASPEVKRIRGKRLSARYSEADSAAELEKAWLNFLCAIESDKLYYFILAANNPQPVVLVKSPADNKAMKTFLGYEWSSRKGDEGIKYIGATVSIADDEDEALSRNKGIAQIKTPLFNPVDLADSQKINSIIRAAFNGKTLPVPDSLSEFVSRAPLTRLLDFSRVTFDKAFKTMPETKIEITSKYPLVKLDGYVNVEYGDRIVRKSATGDKYPVYGGGGETFRTDEYNRESRFIISRFGMSPECVRFIEGKFYLNDSGLTVSSKKEEIISSRFIDFYLFVNQETVFLFGRGSAQKNMDMEAFRQFQIPLPPLDIQHQIVAGCEKVDEECETARKTIEENKAATEKIILSVFGKYETRLLENVCDSFEYGTSAKSSPVGEVAVIRMGNIQEGAIVWNDVVYTSDPVEIEKYALKKNDVLFNRTNSPVWVGKTGLYTGDRPAIFAGYLIRVNYQPTMLNPKFLTYILNSTPIREYGFSVMSKAINQANISAGLLKKYQIPVPPLAEQNRIVAEVEKYETEIASARAILAAAPARKHVILKNFLF